MVVDASQGVEAQTVANVNLAEKNHLVLIPVINKVDLPSADPERVCQQIEDELAIDSDDAIEASAKTGLGIEEILADGAAQARQKAGEVLLRAQRACGIDVRPGDT